MSSCCLEISLFSPLGLQRQFGADLMGSEFWVSLMNEQQRPIESCQDIQSAVAFEVIPSLVDVKMLHEHYNMRTLTIARSYLIER